jgi:hypothetical protein
MIGDDQPVSAEAHPADVIGETGPAAQDGQDVAEIELTVAISDLIRKGNMAQRSDFSYVAQLNFFDPLRQFAGTRRGLAGQTR